MDRVFVLLLAFISVLLFPVWVVSSIK